MTTRKTDKSVQRTATRDVRRAKDRGVDQLLVYCEVSVTIKVNDENYIKYTLGHERLVEGTDDKAIKKAADAACDFGEAVIDKRARKVARLVEKIAAGRRERD